MAVTLQQIEGVPASWPAVPAGLSVEAAALDPEFVWGRIEPYTTFRFSSRSVAWVVEGPGEWVAPVAPATIAAVGGWTGTAWAAVAVARRRDRLEALQQRLVAAGVPIADFLPVVCDITKVRSAHGAPQACAPIWHKA